MARMVSGLPVRLSQGDSRLDFQKMANDRMSEPGTAPSAPIEATPQRGASSFAGAWPLAILLLMATLPYAGILRNDFAYAYDDNAQIIDNPYVHSLGHIREILTTNVWSYKGAQGETFYYRPMMTLGFLLCFQIFGPLAYGFHLASLILHAAVVAMIYLFACRLFRDGSAGFATAALFALHPIHVESVAWISAVTDLELTFFYVLTFWFLVQLGACSGRRRGWTLAGACVSFTLAILSKEQALTLPMLAVLYEFGFRDEAGGATRAERLVWHAPLWLLDLGYLGMRASLLGAVTHSTGWHPLTPYQTILSALALAGQYIFKLFWPAHLLAFYEFVPSTSLFQPAVLGGIAVLALCAGSFIALWNRALPAAFGILWLLVNFGPVLNARWMIAYVFAERYAYLPSVGFCLTAGWLLVALWKWVAPRQAVWRALGEGAACAVVLLCVWRIVTRVPVWRDDITLLTSTLAEQPEDYILHNGLGQAYSLRGETDAAAREYRESLRLKPDFIQSLSALGIVDVQRKDYGEAIELLSRAITLDPRNAEAHLNLGAADAETGKPDLAEAEFRAAITLAPMNFAAHNALGKLYFDTGKLREAQGQFLQSIACEPNLAACDHLGYIYMRWGDRERAETAFKAALSLNSTDSHAHYNLGLICAASGRIAQAREEFQAALAADPNNPEISAALAKLQP